MHFRFSNCNPYGLGEKASTLKSEPLQVLRSTTNHELHFFFTITYQKAISHISLDCAQNEEDKFQPINLDKFNRVQHKKDNFPAHPPHHQT